MGKQVAICGEVAKEPNELERVRKEGSERVIFIRGSCRGMLGAVDKKKHRNLGVTLDSRTLYFVHHLQLAQEKRQSEILNWASRSLDPHYPAARSQNHRLGFTS
ncbi:hypothetical protein H6P81_001471 [Aristolochia fimbriata]|uniref:Uncharacterized protein n=1 Tax=Aristolochia fimbriata TaxID=158543 RepID=A0AAV7FBK1_ARIFI|nr:hypothetical protein H6P81_001471 [Aristolochia fimbriata]